MEIIETKPKFTPGPWYVDEEFSQAHIRYKEGTRCVVSEEHGGICETTRGWEDEQTSPANAALIAAAPELYEALRDVLSEFLPNVKGPVTERARRALVKAQGEL